MSKKTGKLTKVEKFYIDNHPNSNVADLAKDLNRTEKCISNHVEKDTGHTAPTRDNEDESSVSDLMGRKEDRGVTIMTQAASELADETRPQRIEETSRYKNSIHVIKEKDE